MKTRAIPASERSLRRSVRDVSGQRIVGLMMDAERDIRSSIRTERNGSSTSVRRNENVMVLSSGALRGNGDALCHGLWAGRVIRRAKGGDQRADGVIAGAQCCLRRAQGGSGRARRFLGKGCFPIRDDDEFRYGRSEGPGLTELVADPDAVLEIRDVPFRWAMRAFRWDGNTVCCYLGTGCRVPRTKGGDQRADGVVAGAQCCLWALRCRARACCRCGKVRRRISESRFSDGQNRQERGSGLRQGS